MFMRKSVTLSIVFFASLVGSSAAPARAKGADQDPVVHVYVMRRQLLGQPVPSVRSWAHSALLLKTKAGKFYTLEFMSDSKAHLTASTPKEISVDQKRKVALIKMEGWGDGKQESFEWERQLLGKELDAGQAPAELRDLMQAQMKEYSVWDKEHCHTAQERLRKQLKLLE
jgi:hypothetical protein